MRWLSFWFGLHWMPRTGDVMEVKVVSMTRRSPSSYIPAFLVAKIEVEYVRGEKKKLLATVVQVIVSSVAWALR